MSLRGPSEFLLEFPYCFLVAFFVFSATWKTPECATE